MSSVFSFFRAANIAADSPAGPAPIIINSYIGINHYNTDNHYFNPFQEKSFIPATLVLKWEMKMFKTAFISQQGRRAEMEDAYYLDLNFADRKWIYGGIYDGHGGSYTAHYSAEHLPGLFLQKYLSSNSPRQAFIESYEEIADAVKHHDCGSTAVDFFIKDEIVFTANAGDSRVIIISQDTTRQLTIDHRLGNPEEEQRIISMGGEIKPPYIMRGLAGLMPTRSIGDEYFKQVGVIATPAVSEYHIRKDDLYLIAACDGLFDSMDNEEIALFARRYRNPEILLAALQEEVLIKWHGTDNLTIIAVMLNEPAIIKLTV